MAWHNLDESGWVGARRRRLMVQAEELGTDIISQAPNDLVTATLRKLVGREDQREVIGNFKAVQLQPHAAVGEVFYETRTFFTAHGIAATRPSWWRGDRRFSLGMLQ